MSSQSLLHIAGHTDVWTAIHFATQQVDEALLPFGHARGRARVGGNSVVRCDVAGVASSAQTGLPAEAHSACPGPPTRFALRRTAFAWHRSEGWRP